MYSEECHLYVASASSSGYQFITPEAGNDPILVYVVFVVKEVAVGQASAEVLGSFHVGIIPPILHTFR